MEERHFLQDAQWDEAQAKLLEGMTGTSLQALSLAISTDSEN